LKVLLFTVPEGNASIKEELMLLHSAFQSQQEKSANVGIMNCCTSHLPISSRATLAAIRKLQVKLEDGWC
jgi:hypothetical protein